ncbi:hypothetical protein ACWDPI_28240, partial [Streptomyces zhihengii]
MNAHLRRAAVAAAATAMAVSLAACGSAKESGDSTKESAEKKGDDITIGLLLPENQTARYEKFDKPLIEKKMITSSSRVGSLNVTSIHSPWP